MEAQERRVVLDELESSEARIVEVVEGLTPAQWVFRETPERWSIADNIEHLVVFEGFIRGMIAKAMEGVEEAEKSGLASGKEHLVLGVANGRSNKLIARDAVRPVGRWTAGAELMAELRRARAETLAFAAETDADLRGHFFPHIAFGDLDCYQWLVVLGQHSVRHVFQIEEIKRDAAFPAA
jgi:hypothetical protein